MKTGAGEHNPEFPSLLKNLELVCGLRFESSDVKIDFTKKFEQIDSVMLQSPKLSVSNVCPSVGNSIVLLLPGFCSSSVSFISSRKRREDRYEKTSC